MKNLIHRKLRARFYVTPVQGVTFSGVLTHHDRGREGYSVFNDVKVHPAEGEPKPAVGELYIRNSNIAYLQSVPTDVSV